MLLSKRVWIAISGALWLGVGIMLLTKGLQYLIASIQSQSAPLIHLFSAWTNSSVQAGLLLVSLSLLIGFIKGRMVLAKTVAKMVGRLQGEKLSFTQVYDKRYGLLLLVMASLGFLLKLVPLDVRGAIDIAVGSALINGSIFYFRKVASLC
jgi:hypothetical protein